MKRMESCILDFVLLDSIIYISRNGIGYKETKLSISHVRNLIPFL